MKKIMDIKFTGCFYSPAKNIEEEKIKKKKEANSMKRALKMEKCTSGKGRVVQFMPPF